jgi:Fic family protein
LTKEFIIETHKIITSNISYASNVPGNYRPHEVKVGDKDHGGVYTPPKCLPDIEALMAKFVEWINSEPVKSLDPLLRGALAHYHLGLIHPFGDGNGRVARIVEAFMLRLSNIKYVPTMLSNYYYRKMDAYYWAFSLARKNKENDVTPFLAFVLEGVIDSLNEIKGGITDNLQILIMRDYVAYLREKKHVSQRQCDLINMLLSKWRPVTLQDLLTVTPFNALCRNVSERTARRDLQKLSDKSIGVLKLQDDKYVLNYGRFK